MTKPKDPWKSRHIPPRTASFVYADNSRQAEVFRQRAKRAFDLMKIASDACNWGPGLGDRRWSRGFKLLHAGVESVKTERDIEALEAAYQALNREKNRQTQEEIDRGVGEAYARAK